MRSIDELLNERASRGEARGADAVFDAAEAASPDAEVVPLGRRRPIAPLAVAAAVLAIVASVAVTSMWADEDDGPIDDVAIGTEGGGPTLGEQIAVLQIPALGITADVVEGIGLEQTMPANVGHVPESALPGTEGPTVLVGPAACGADPFAELGDLAEGDQVLISVGGGTAAYEVTSVEVVEEDADQWITATGEDRQLRLSTCVFDADLDPVMIGVTASLTDEPLSDEDLAGDAGDLTQLLGKPTDDVVVLDDGYGTVTMLAPEDRIGVRWDVTAGLSTQPLDWQQVRVERLGDDLVVGWDGGVHLVPLDGDDPVSLGEATTFAVAEEADGVWLLSGLAVTEASRTRFEPSWRATLVSRNGEAQAEIDEPALEAEALGLEGFEDSDLFWPNGVFGTLGIEGARSMGDGLVLSREGDIVAVDDEGELTVIRSRLVADGDRIDVDRGRAEVLDASDDRVLWCEGEYTCSRLHLFDVTSGSSEELGQDSGGWSTGVFSPDGSTVAVVPERSALVLFVDESGSEDVVHADFLAGLPAGERSAMAWDPDGEAVYVTTALPTGSETPLARFGTDGSVQFAELPLSGFDGDVVVLDRDAVVGLDELPACSEGAAVDRCAFPLG
ncbi:MAG: sortase [Actinomycetota bacterium]|nr:sortase [Actinomycetota bacterium]